MILQLRCLLKLLEHLSQLGASLNSVGKKTFVIMKIEDEKIIKSIIDRCSTDFEDLKLSNQKYIFKIKANNLFYKCSVLIMHIVN